MPTSYRSYRPGDRIIDLLMAQGQQRAENAARTWGGIGESIAGIGEQIGGALEQRRAQQAEEMRSRRFNELMSSDIWQADPRRGYMQLASLVGPDKAKDVLTGLKSAQELGEGPELEPKALLERAQLVHRGYEALPEGARATAWTSTLVPLMRKYKVGPEVIPDERTPEGEAALKAMLQPQGVKPTGEIIETIGPGGQPIKRRVSEEELAGPGVPVYRPPVKEATPAVGSFEDYVVQKYGPRPTPGQIAQARREYQETGNAPPTPSFQAKEVLDEAGQPVLANYDSRTGRYVNAETGQPVRNPRPVPSAQAAADANKFKTAGPVMQSVSELSERINTLQGVAAKASGEAEKLKAQANLNDDVAEYQALIMGFTPLVARALGHTGVLTEQDVQSVRELFPKPGDSKSLRDRKVARVNKIMGALQGQGGATSRVVVQRSKKTGAVRHSLDGGATWQAGPPQ